MAFALGADHAYAPGEHAAAVAAGDARRVDRAIECPDIRWRCKRVSTCCDQGAVTNLSPSSTTADLRRNVGNCQRVRIEAKVIYLNAFASAIDLLACAAIDIALLTSALMSIDDFNNAFDALRQPEGNTRALIRIP